MCEPYESDLQSRKASENNEKIEIILRQITMKGQENLEDPLENHSIQPSLRARMAEWMIEVIASFNLKHRTYFLSVNLMDMFLKNAQREYTSKSLQTIGLACMIIASKFNDSHYITVDVAHKFICQAAISEAEIVGMETEVLRLASECLAMITSYDIVCVLCEKYKVGDKVKRTAITILYLIQLYYDALVFTMNEQAFSAFLISLYTLRQKSVIEEVNREGDCRVDRKIVEMVHGGMLKFVTSFPCFRNPMRFLGFDFNRERSCEIFSFVPCCRFE